MTKFINKTLSNYPTVMFNLIQLQELAGRVLIQTEFSSFINIVMSLLNKSGSHNTEVEFTKQTFNYTLVPV